MHLLLQNVSLQSLFDYSVSILNPGKRKWLAGLSAHGAFLLGVLLLS
jgi:hypothetical protein